MEEVKCVGINSNNVPVRQFHLQFQQLCMREGTIVMFSANNHYAAALVIR